MVKKLVFSLDFERTIQEIYHFISIDSLKYANLFYANIIKAVETISQFPEIGVVFKHKYRRYLVHKDYFILYEIMKDNITMLNISHVKNFR